MILTWNSVEEMQQSLLGNPFLHLPSLVSRTLQGLNFPHVFVLSSGWPSLTVCLPPPALPSSQGWLLQMLPVKNLPGRPQLGYSNTWCHLDPPPSPFLPLPFPLSRADKNPLRSSLCFCVSVFCWLHPLSCSVHQSFHFFSNSLCSALSRRTELNFHNIWSLPSQAKSLNQLLLTYPFTLPLIFSFCCNSLVILLFQHTK